MLLQKAMYLPSAISLVALISSLCFLILFFSAGIVRFSRAYSLSLVELTRVW